MWNKLVTWFKTTGVTLAVDSLDMAVPYLTVEIDSLKGKFSKMSSNEQAKLVVDKVQEFLRKQFKLDA